MRLLNARANVSRYSASGSTQSNGTGVTSSSNLLVMESSSMELQAARPTQSSLSSSVGGLSVSPLSAWAEAAVTLLPRANHAAAEDSSTKITKIADHNAACLRGATRGSISNG